MSASKTELRRTLLERRSLLSHEQSASASAAIVDHLRTLLRDVSTLAAFSSTQNEVDLTPLYDELLARGVDVCFPRVEGPGQMVFAQIANLSELTPGAYGILEPSGPPLALGRIEAFLVPGIGFDRAGMRLGFGGGFYDRALAARRTFDERVPLFVGIGYSCQVLDTFLPAEDWDVPMDSIVTESGVIRVP